MLKLVYKSGVQGGIIYTSVISDESGNKGADQHLRHFHMCKIFFSHDATHTIMVTRRF